MSGYTNEPVTLGGAADGAVPFIQKPFAPAALAAMVREVVGPKDGSRQPTRR
jgi:FixJ family two-component response regulator